MHRASVLAAAALAVTAAPALAQPGSGPPRPAGAGYHMLVADARESDADKAARALARAIVEVRGAEDVRIDPVPGGRGTAAMARFVREFRGRPDALLFGGQDMVAAAELDRAATRVQEATPLARLAVSHFVVRVPAGAPHRTMKDLAKAFAGNPESIVWDVGEKGGARHLFVAYIARALRVDPARIRTAAEAGNSPAATAFVRDSRDIGSADGVAIAISSPAALHGVPSLREQGIDVVFGRWSAVFAAPGITPTQRDELLRRVKAATETKPWQLALGELGWQPVFLYGADFARFVDEESRALGHLADSLGLRRKK
jgi:putative tricarboxylic transport membrane protein